MYVSRTNRFYRVSLFIILVFATLVDSQDGKCPTLCSCKWKRGKQTVECLDKDLRSIPEPIDMETQVFDSSGNNLQTLSREIFLRSGLVNLQKLFLRNCKIRLVNELAFKGLINLIELDLSFNLLTSIPSNTLKDILFLRELIISNNPIRKIGSLAFQDIHGLVILDLSNCEIQTIAPHAFEGIEMLESLKLHGNQLSELVVGTIENLRHLHGIELHNNPWYCDCRLRSVKKWLSNTSIVYSEVPKCLGGPEIFIEESFTKLHIDDFACKPEMLPVSRYIETVSENNVSIVCRANAIPSPQLKWFWHGKQLQNNSAISLATKVQIYEEGTQEKNSILFFMDIKGTDRHEFYCVAENRAGNCESNFTLIILKKPFRIINLDSENLIGLGGGLVSLFFFIIVIISLILTRLRRLMKCYKTSNQQILTEISSEPKNIIPNKEIKAPFNIYNLAQTINHSNEIQYSTIHYNGNGSVMSESCMHSSSAEMSSNQKKNVKFKDGEHIKNINTLFCNNLENVSEKKNDYLLSSSYLILDQQGIYVSNGGNQNNSKILNVYKISTEYPEDYGLPIVEPNQEYTLGANTKTLRIWQKGAVPVLPSNTPLKNIFELEGFHEGCGTDV